MRQGFTLIELMIVIAIIAIIAAIAIPNLLESRITANEAQAASSLKAGIFPGQTQYQAGSYTDGDGDGRGAFANHVASMAGGTSSTAVTTTNALVIGPPKALTLLDPKFANQAGIANHQVVTFTGGLAVLTATGGSANVAAYNYYTHTNCSVSTAEDNCETFFGATACPNKADGSEARRAFGMNAAGTVMMTKQTVTNANAQLILVVGAPAATSTALASTSMYASSPATGIPSPNTANGSPYQK